MVGEELRGVRSWSSRAKATYGESVDDWPLDEALRTGKCSIRG